jgi:hypothetical protein
MVASAYFVANLWQQAFCAEDLELKNNTSFMQDVDNGFPIVAKKIEDDTIEAGTPAFIFFGAAADINTNRQAKRVIDLYNDFRKKKVKFIVIDVDHPSNQGVALVKRYYRGYVPAELIIDGQGQEHWSQIGETELQVMRKQLEQVL